MYQFSNNVLAGLTVSQSVAKAGTTHLKQFTTAGVTPATQNTLNLYISGSFKFEVNGFIQIMNPGETSLDLSITEYPVNLTCTETVLSDWGVRCCVSSKVPWTKEIVNLSYNQTYENVHKSLVLLTQGTVSIGGVVMKGPSYREVPNNIIITGITPTSRIIICRCL